MKRIHKGFNLTCLVVLLLGFSASQSYSEELTTIRGTLVKCAEKFTYDVEAIYCLKTAKSDIYKIYPAEGRDKILESIPSLHAPSFVAQSNGKPYVFEFLGSIDGEKFILQRTPTNVAGHHRLIGVVERDENGFLFKTTDEQEYTLRFGYTNKSNGYEFDDISKESLAESSDILIADGEIIDEIFILQAFLPKTLFQINTEEGLTVVDGPLEFTKNIYKNEISQSDQLIQRTLFLRDDKINHSFEEEYALLVTLSGRQGDSFGPVNGHYVAGFAKVQNGLLVGEFSNGYVTNDKDILSSNTDLVNYYGHLVQGQNIYRPTYTLVVYGIDKEKLLQFRDSLEASHIRFRTEELEITPQFNCTTETNFALNTIGISGRVRNDVRFRTILANPLFLPLSILGTTADTLRYVLSNPASYFHPRSAFDSFIDAFTRERTLKRHGVTRVDYIFFPQIPSHRPVGGAPLGNLRNAKHYRDLHEEYEKGKDLTFEQRESMRDFLAEELNKIE